MHLSSNGQRLVNNELALFTQDYQQHYLADETKPKAIGRPYLLHHPESTQGVLLIHGLMAAPEEVRELAEFLYALGYTVYAPRMAGHGTSAVDLTERQMEEWIESVNRGHEILKDCCQQILVAGFSTGAAVALHQVISKPDAFTALISISAPLKFKKLSAHFAGLVHNWNSALTCLDNRFLSMRRWRKEFVTNHADNPHINYLRCPVSSIVQIKRLMAQVYMGLPEITIPTLVIHASSDPKVDVQSGRAIYQRIRSSKKYYQEIDFDLHGIVRGPITAIVFAAIGQFLQHASVCDKQLPMLP